MSHVSSSITPPKTFYETMGGRVEACEQHLTRVIGLAFKDLEKGEFLFKARAERDCDRRRAMRD